MFRRSALSLRVLSATLVAASLGSVGAARAQSTAAPSATVPTPTVADKPVRLRGTLQSVDATSLTLRERGGEVVTLQRVADMPIAEVFPITLADIKPGSYVGAAALPQPDGTQKALEVLVFPEAARGTGEGYFPWDLMPESTMTNATVEGVAAAPSAVPGGQVLTLRYPGGQKQIVVPADVPVVSFKPGNADAKALLVPGAQMLVTAQVKDGAPTALRVNVGRNGFKPPM